MADWASVHGIEVHRPLCSRPSNSILCESKRERLLHQFHCCSLVIHLFNRFSVRIYNVYDSVNDDPILHEWPVIDWLITFFEFIFFFILTLISLVFCGFFEEVLAMPGANATKAPNTGFRFLTKRNGAKIWSLWSFIRPNDDAAIVEIIENRSN